MTRKCLAAGANINATTKIGDIPLSLACGAHDNALLDDYDGRRFETIMDVESVILLWIDINPRGIAHVDDPSRQDYRLSINTPVFERAARFHKS